MAFHRMESAGAERHGRAGRETERVGASESNALQIRATGQSRLPRAFE
jgi:hypothetical protein